MVMVRTLIQKILIALSFGAVVVAWSEFWFYEIDAEVDSFSIIAAYGVLGYLFLLIVQKYKIGRFAPLFVAASLLGFLIEGVPVPVVYSTLPFSIMWTSLAWHASLSVVIGWVLFKQIMAHGHWLIAALFNAVIGVSFGVWNSYMWHARENVIDGSLSFEWGSVEPFIDQFLFGYILFIAGHFVFERVAVGSIIIWRFEYIALWVLIAALAALTAWASGLWLQALVLPILCIVCLWALSRDPADGGSHQNIAVKLSTTRIPMWRYGLTLFIPLLAIAVFTFMVENQIGFEANVLVALTAGPISVGLFVYSLWRTIKPKAGLLRTTL